MLFFIGGLVVGLFFKYNLLYSKATENAEKDLRKVFLEEMEIMRKLYENRIAAMKKGSR